MPNFRDLLNAAKAEVREVDTAEADELRQRPGAVVLDVREPDEYEQGAIPGAVHIPRGTLETKVEAALPRGRKVIIYCAGGNRSALAADTLQQMGYTDVASMAGGFRHWAQSGGEVEG